MHVGALLLLLTVLTACTGVPNTQVQRSSATGISGVHSDLVRLTDHPHHVLLADVQVISRREETVYILRIGRSYDGVHHGLRLDRAWAAGRKLPYRAARRGARMCTALHCNAHLLGRLSLSPAMMQQARQNGIAFRLTGRSGAIDVALRPDPFVQALSRAQSGGIIPVFTQR